MKEKVIVRNKEDIIEVRSDAGKLLYVKTKEGYELKCSRSKQICVISYEQMLVDSYRYLKDKIDLSKFNDSVLIEILNKERV